VYCDETSPHRNIPELNMPLEMTSIQEPLNDTLDDLDKLFQSVATTQYTDTNLFNGILQEQGHLETVVSTAVHDVVTSYFH